MSRRPRKKRKYPPPIAERKIPISGAVAVIIQRFKSASVDGVDIRKFYFTNTYKGWSKQGIYIPISIIDEVIRALIELTTPEE